MGDLSAYRRVSLNLEITTKLPFTSFEKRTSIRMHYKKKKNIKYKELLLHCSSINQKEGSDSSLVETIAFVTQVDLSRLGVLSMFCLKEDMKQKYRAFLIYLNSVMVASQQYRTGERKGCSKLGCF